MDLACEVPPGCASAAGSRSPSPAPSPWPDASAPHAAAASPPAGAAWPSGAPVAPAAPPQRATEEERGAGENLGQVRWIAGKRSCTSSRPVFVVTTRMSELPSSSVTVSRSSVGVAARNWKGVLAPLMSPAWVT